MKEGIAGTLKMAKSKREVELELETVGENMIVIRQNGPIAGGHFSNAPMRGGFG